MGDERTLASYQAALLDHLSKALLPAEIRQHLLSDPRTVPYRAQLDRADPRMLEVAAHLVIKWGVRVVRQSTNE